MEGDNQNDPLFPIAVLIDELKVHLSLVALHLQKDCRLKESRR